MKVVVNPAVVASFFVILGSVSVGVVSGVTAFYLGSESLKTVNSPEENPTQKLGKWETVDLKKYHFQPVEEKTVLVKVYNYVQEQRRAVKEQARGKAKEKGKDK
ncbi:MAG: hypothetical protein NZ901_07810 [Geminocystis sp.]|nr:hypothetical protein [Geminocystis sp.]HIK37006.1 hypothetical protein [Geminocystis sp. M7585_C2015_104]MCS7148078.1 hypothetical protein [Geminocystis sp.]MCX8077822.1 hypothetical protein [Geminocystis sp.]MDW8116430.1 hypothetical protein [Geminocystis sp.]